MPTLFVKFYLIHKIAPKFLAIAIEREFNKRAMALYTCVDKGNEKLACDALWPKYITPNGLGGHMTSDLKSATLNTRVSMCILSPTASEAMVASKQPQRS